VPAAHLVDMLEQSELLHKVVKKNAGKANENVKHPMSVVRTLNEYLFPSHSIFLEHVHHNSYTNLKNHQKQHHTPSLISPYIGGETDHNTPTKTHICYSHKRTVPLPPLG
jgi:hypothetical protein